MVYDYSTTGPERVISGIGALDQLPQALEAIGARRALLITGRTLAAKTDLVERVQLAMQGTYAGTFSECDQHVPESAVEKAYEQALSHNVDTLVVFGGGSPIDTAKMVALWLLKAGNTHVNQVAIPTTLSAGEFTHAAGMTNEDTRIKSVHVDPRMQPRVVLFDPELTRPTPGDLWLSTGIKALDHAVEGVWWPNCHPLVEPLRLSAIDDLTANLARSQDPDALDARLVCQHAAWKSITGLLSAKDVGFRLSHPLGHQIGARWDVPHGVTSCIALPGAARFLHSRTREAQQRIATAMGMPGSDEAAPAIEAFLDTLDVPRRLSETAAKRDEIPAVADAVAAELAHLNAPDADLATAQRLTELLESMW
ncbi:MAG: alcohol dehydrogenase class IV [Gammaproteobacteria bacterium]|jgi:alcohol dehydrogenase class IV